MTREEAVALLERYSNYDGMGIPNLAGCKEAMKVAADALKEVYPELAESDDEKALRIIRKRMCYDPVPISDEDRRIVENWLEKQKEQKPNFDTHWENGSMVCKQKEQKPAEWRPEPESLEALMYAIEGEWEKIKPTSYLSRRLEDLYEGLVNTFNVGESFLAELPKTAYTAKDIEELRELKDKIEASMESPVDKPAEWSEEDDDNLCRVIRVLEDNDSDWKELSNWLKSLRPSWKPSEGCYGSKGDPDPAGVWKPSEEELGRKHLEGYIMGREDTMREMKDFVESHFNCENAKKGTPIVYNTQSGTAIATLDGNTSATDGKPHNPSFTD